MPDRWQNQEDPTKTGVDVDSDYCAAHQYERTVSVGYDAQASVEGQSLATDGGNGAGSDADAWIDGNAQRHTAAGASSIVGSTFYADDARNTSKFERLWLFHSGKDSHKRGNGSDVNPLHKEDQAARFNHERAEIICDVVGLAHQQKRAVLDAVDGTNFARFTYLGAMETVVVGIIACVLAFYIDEPLGHAAVEEAADMIGVDDVEYVVGEVAEKKDFNWINDPAMIQP